VRWIFPRPDSNWTFYRLDSKAERGIVSRFAAVQTAYWRVYQQYPAA